MNYKDLQLTDVCNVEDYDLLQCYYDLLDPRTSKEELKENLELLDNSEFSKKLYNLTSYLVG